MVLGFCGLGLFSPLVFMGLRSLGSGFLGLRIFQSSVPKVLRSFGSGILGLRNFSVFSPLGSKVFRVRLFGS